MTRIRCSGVIRVAAPIAETYPLFLASGERRWARGWDPRFPAPAEDETQPGTVFTTAGGGTSTTWIVTAAEPPATISYARCTPGERAGTVVIVCRPATAHATDVEVSYDLTSLTPDAEPALQAFEDRFPAFLEHWETAIDAAIERRPT